MTDDSQTGQKPPVTPEQIIPRLGESLIQAGFITQLDLEKALNYQLDQKAQGKTVLLGKALLELGLIVREQLDQIVIQQLVSLHSVIEENNLQLEKRVRERTQDLENRLVQIRTAAEITQLGIKAQSLDELLHQTVELIFNRFGYHLVSLFLTDDSGKQAVLTAVAGALSEQIHERNICIEIGSRSMIGWVMAHNEPRVASDVETDFFYLRDDLLSDTKAELTLPISMGNQVLGALDVQHTTPNVFDPEVVAVLQTIANHFAFVIQNYRLLYETQARLQEVSSLYGASHQLEQAETVNAIFQVLSDALKAAPLPAALLRTEGVNLHLEAAFSESGEPVDLAALKSGSHERNLDQSATEHVPAGASKYQLSLQELETYLDAEKPLLVLEVNPAGPRRTVQEPVKDASLTHQQGDEIQSRPSIIGKLLASSNFTGPVSYVESLSGIPQLLGYRIAVFLPVRINKKLEAVLLLGSYQENGLSQTNLQSYASLCEQASTALEKVIASQRLEKRLAALETLNAISQAVSVQTDLWELYQTTHQEVAHIMGNVSFLIALYNPLQNTIEVPYMYEEGSVSSIEAFPLGEGAVSILINSRKSLMIVEDADRQLEQLGSKLVGKPVKSWLGVPLLVAGDVIGAMVVQDIEREHRFDEDDRRLLETLASQVAVAIRNARLLVSTHDQAERERLLNQITNKLRSCTDINTILATTAEELRKAMKARSAHIQISPSPLESTVRQSDRSN